MAPYLWLLGLLFLGLRALWEWWAPVGIGEFKGVFYVRDYLTLLPSAVCFYRAILRLDPHSRLASWEPRLAGFVSKLTGRGWRTAFLCALLLFIACTLISLFVFRTRAHYPDEANYLFQAEIFASGRLWADPPPVSPDFFKLRFIVYTADKRYGSFFPGMSLALVPGVLGGAPYLVNPILNALLLLLTVWAGWRLFDLRVGLIAGGLMLFSPFTLFLGASYFSHIATAIPFLIATVGLLTSASVLPAVGIGLCGSFVLLCRPLSAVLLGIFACLRWAWQLYSRQRPVKSVLIQALFVGLGFCPGIVLFLGYNYLLTGHYLLTPHEVAWPEDRMSLGPHTLKNTLLNLGALSVDMLGVPLFSFLPLLVYACSSDRKWFRSLLLLTLLYMGGYGLYFYQGSGYGPRFYFEIFPLLLIVAGKGLLLLPEFLSRWFGTSADRWRYSALAFCLVNGVVCGVGLLPPRVWSYYQRALYYDIRPLVQSLPTPAVVFISNPDTWRLYPYMAGFQLNDLKLQGAILFARDLKERNTELLAAFPHRRAFLLDLQRRQIEPFDPDHQGGL